MQTPLAITCFCFESKGSLQIRWLVLARASMKKLMFLRASTQHITVYAQAETTLTFLSGEKDMAKAETASREDGDTRFGTWGTHHHKGKYRRLQHRRSLRAGRASSAQKGCYTEAPDETPAPLPLRVASHPLKVANRYEIHTRGKIYGKLSKENKRKAAVLPDSCLW